MNDTRRVCVYIAASVDGYIALPNDDLSFLSIVEREGEDYGYTAFENSVDTVILGGRTYNWVLREAGYFPHANKETYVVTRTSRPSQGTTTFYTGDLQELVQTLKSRSGGTIFVDGGSYVVNQLLQRHLIDEMIISIVPVLLGRGLPLFVPGRRKSQLQLLQVTTFASGLVQVHYRCTQSMHPIDVPRRSSQT